VRLPLAGRTIPVIADEYVDREFGTGVVGDARARSQRLRGGPAPWPADARRAEPDATINDNAPERYRGLDRFVARKKVVNDPRHDPLVEAKKHKLVAALRAHRPDRRAMLTDQWFWR
jgi:valyl-tRNA synthetase